MRFDDTNPVKEEQEYVDAILDSVHWLGFDWKHPDGQSTTCTSPATTSSSCTTSPAT